MPASSRTRGEFNGPVKVTAKRQVISGRVSLDKSNYRPWWPQAMDKNVRRPIVFIDRVLFQDTNGLLSFIPADIIENVKAKDTDGEINKFARGTLLKNVKLTFFFSLDYLISMEFLYPYREENNHRRASFQVLLKEILLRRIVIRHENIHVWIELEIVAIVIF